MVFPDTSFLSSLYRKQVHSPRAIAFMAQRSGPIPVSSLLLLEFRHSLRLQVRLHPKDKTNGFTKLEAAQILEVMPVDWSAVHQTAEESSDRYAENKGNRLANILHAAIAFPLGADELLTFDANQKALAVAEGLAVKL